MKLPSYGDLPAGYDLVGSSRYLLLPVPYDATSTWLKGAAQGPEALLEASTHMELYDIETRTEVYRQGIHTALPPDVRHAPPEEMVRRVQEETGKWLDQGKTVVTVGGEHSVAIGAFYAHAERSPGLSVLQLDAHADMRETYEGSRYNHACVAARMSEKAPLTQVGIRSMDRSEEKKMDPKRTFFACELDQHPDWMEKVVETLGPDVYITLDLDVLDPAVMPSTGTPEPGGLDWYILLQLLKKVFSHRNVVGFDLCELAPLPEHKAPDFLAAKLLYKMLTYHHLYHP